MAKSRKKVNHPWVQVAAFADTVLEDKGGALSVIRIVDRFTLPKPPGWDGKTHLDMPVFGLLAFKSGDVKGQRTIRIYGTSPKGKRKKVFEQEVEFPGGDVGINMTLRMAFAFKTEGTHWLDVYVDRWLATRMPLTVVLQPIENPEGEPPPGSGQRKGRS
jgi:hypothetical protein